MNSLDSVQQMAQKQGKTLEIFKKIRLELLALASEMHSTEPKTAEFLKNFAEGGFKSVMQHYILESRSNLRKATDEIQIDEILSNVNKESVSKEAMIITLQKAPDA